MRVVAVGVALVALVASGCSKKDKDEAKPAEPTTEKKEDPKEEPTKEEPKNEEPAKPAIPDGVACIEDTNKKIENGKLAACRLEKDYTSGDMGCTKEYMAYFFADGSLKGCYVSKPTTVDGWTCTGMLSLLPGGKFRRCKLAKEKEAVGVQLKVGDWVTAYPNGSLRRLENQDARKVGKYTCKGSVNLWHENGKLKRCLVAKDTKVGKKTVKAGEAACFDPEGEPTECGSVLADIAE